MDEQDLATEREEIARQSALFKSRKPEGPAATGRCLYCDDITNDFQRWCDARCRDLDEKEKRNG